MPDPVDLLKIVIIVWIVTYLLNAGLRAVGMNQFTSTGD